MESSHTLLSLSLIKGVGNVALSLFNDYCKEEVKSLTKPGQIIEVFKNLRNLNKRVKELDLKELERAFVKADNIIKDSKKLGINITTINDPQYPKLLKSIKNYPLILHSKGSYSAISQKPTIAIIGTRTPSNFGIKLGKRISDVIIENGFTIVSGLALGCDTLGHQAAINANAQTVAVMAGGLDSVYPKENSLLAAEIIDNNGLLISEHPIGVKPSRSTFINRDRIQSGLSLGTLIIQTSEKGGTLHTAKYTLEQERVLACIATDKDLEMNHDQFKGNKKLIKSGALEVSNQDQVLNFINEIYRKRDCFKKDEDRSELKF